MNHCSIVLWYNKQRLKRDGTATLYLRISVGSETDEVKLNISWPIRFIDWEKRVIRPRSDDDPDYNTFVGFIEREREKYWSVVRDFLNANKTFTLADVFRSANYYRGGNTLCEFMRLHIIQRQKTDNLRDKIKESTAKVHKCSLSKIKEYLGEGNDILLTEVNDMWLDKFARYLYKTMGDGGANVKIQNIKSYLSYAHRHKIAVNLDHKRFNIKVEEPEANFLEDFELEALLNLYHKAEIAGDLMQALRTFLFGCVTGMRVSDLKRWRKDWIIDNKIQFVPVKTRVNVIKPKPVVIPIIPLAHKFIHELKGEGLEIFSEQYYNRQLKEIAVKAGIEKNITSHVARHTFGTWMIMCGVRDVVLQKIMGHKKIESTRRYVHIADSIKGRAMMMLEDQFQKFIT